MRPDLKRSLMSPEIVEPSRALTGVKYEIRGRLARRALELERMGYEIIALNIGNPGLYGFRTPETMRLAMIENLQASEPTATRRASSRRARRWSCSSRAAA
jgi:aspartate/methionine/tyrosine aminotransferase